MTCGAAVAAAPSRSFPEPVSYTPKHLASRIVAEQAAMEARGAQEGERKHITALFADIKGSVELAENLDPEEARRIIDPALRIMMDAVHRYEGYVAQTRGDGILALFGAPIAVEDHAHRALHAALRMQQEIAKYSDRVRSETGSPLEVRVGANSGEVVVRSIRKDDLHTDYEPIGHSVNLAARMEALANPGSVAVPESTRRLTEGYFEFRALGAARLKGVSEPVEVYEVVGVGPLRTKLEMAARRGLTRFVGRQAEMAQLEKAFGLAKSGRGQIVGIIGEPGIGKSRLVREFKLTSQRDCLTLETFAVSHGKSHPYLPLIDLLGGYFRIAAEDDDGRRREKIAGKVESLDRALEGVLPYLFALLGVLEEDSPVHHMDAPIRRSRTFDGLKRLLLRETKNQPLSIVVEDLHWIDDESGAFLTALGDGIATARLLLLTNYRPEYEQPWGNGSYVHQIRLKPLEKTSATEMLAGLLGEARELESLKRRILEKSDGTPFFIEEIVRGLFEQGVLVSKENPTVTKPLGEIRIPATVGGMLASRIDRLPPDEKELLQAAAVIGREFPLSVLAGVTGQSEERLRSLLSSLQRAEFVYEELAAVEPQYIFKHALTRDVAASSLLNERRAVLHEHAAQAIEAIYANRLQEHWSELADHYGQSRNTDKAIEYSRLAAERALRLSANAEAIRHLANAIRLLLSLSDTPERAERELDLQLALGVAETTTQGWGASDVENTFARALELCDRAGDQPKLFPALRGLWEVHEIQAKLKSTRELAERLLALAEQDHDPDHLIEAHHALGETTWLYGEFARARGHLEQSLSLYDPLRHRDVSFHRGGYDLKVACKSFLASTLWFLGYPDQAARAIQDALAWSREIEHPFSLAFAHGCAALLHQFRREPPATIEHAEASTALAEEQGFSLLSANATLIRGWALSASGGGQEGIGEMRSGQAAGEATGCIVWQSYFHSLLAEGYAANGRIDEALAAVEQGFAHVQRTEECWWESELFRLRGELLLQCKVPSEIEAEACFRQAIDIAARQQAKSLELRSMTSLARLLRTSGRAPEARASLSEVYRWFTEGFDTADLMDAKALLDELQESNAAAPHAPTRA